jgi:hypothetical protein
LQSFFYTVRARTAFIIRRTILVFIVVPIVVPFTCFCQWGADVHSLHFRLVLYSGTSSVVESTRMHVCSPVFFCDVAGIELVVHVHHVSAKQMHTAGLPRCSNNTTTTEYK